MLALVSCGGAQAPRVESSASAALLPETFTMFLVERSCERDDTPERCDPVAFFPLRVTATTTLLGSFTPSDAMCGPFDITVELDQKAVWSGTVPGGGKANSVGTFVLGEVGAGSHLLTMHASAADPCYGRWLEGWYGAFTIAASNQRVPVAVQPPEVAASKGAVAPSPEPSPGRDVFVTCEPCHGADGAGRLALNAPAIAGQEPWYLERQIRNFQSGRRGTHDADLYGMQMRPMALELTDPARVSAVVDYIASLPAPTHPRTVQGDVQKGADLFLVCAVCHGDDGQGTRDAGAPRLTVQQDWYLVRQIMNFRDRLRGYHAEDRYGYEMQVVTGNLEDEQAARDVVAFIQTLRDRPRRPTVSTTQPPTVALASGAAPVAPSAAPPTAEPPDPSPPVVAPPVAAVQKAEAPAVVKPAPPAPAPASTAPPPVKASAPPPAAAGPSVAELRARGEPIYARICSPCHQANGQGLPGVFPPLAGGGSFYGGPKKHAGIIINGLSGEIVVNGATYNGVMPPQGSLSDLDIAAVATFVRTSWGNADGPVMPADVAAAR